MTKPVFVKNKVEFHCTKCCGPNVIKTNGCQCGAMKDGIVTIFKKDGSPHWRCRRCADSE